MSDFETKLDDLEQELADRTPASTSPSQPLSLDAWLAKNGSTPAPAAAPPAQNNPQPVDNVPLAPAPARAPATLPGDPTLGVGSTPPAPVPEVKDYIGNRLTQQDQALKNAQEQARQNQGLANITEGLGQMTAGAARANNFDPKGYKSFHDQANQPVENLQAQQKGKIASLQEMNAENSTQRTSALDDPNSMQSTIARRLAAQSLAKYKEDPSIVEGMSAADLKEFLQKPLDQMEARDSKEAIVKLKQQELGLKRRELDQGRQDKQSQKASHDQDQALQNVSQLLESARGNPAAAQAERDIYAAQKADSLAKLYGDPNKLSPQMVQLLQSEVGKIAQGGAPSMHELEGLNVTTMPKALAGAMQTLTNAPSPANAGAFVKQYQDYAHALTKDAQNVIQDKYGRVIDTNKDRVGPDNYEKLKTNYINRFPKAADAGGLKPFSDPDKEKRYQEWKAQQGGQ